MSFYYPRAVMGLELLLEDFQLTSDASKQKTYPLKVQPKTVTLSVNDYKTADSFTAELDYKNFPFDPRSIRACGVTIYAQDMESLTLPDGSDNELTPSELNAVFQGFADKDKITYDDNAGVVHLEGRDYTSLLLDQKYKENAPVYITQPLDRQIKSYLETFPATRKIKIVNRTGGVLPTLGKYYPDFGSAKQTDALSKHKLAGAKNVGRHESYWEIIQDIVARAGLICYIHLDELILTTPRNLYSPDKDIKFFMGKNLKTLSFERKLGRQKGFGVTVISRYGKKITKASIPQEATPEWCKSFGIERKPVRVPQLLTNGQIDKANDQPAPYFTFPIPNIADKDQLILIGQTIFEDYSRQQLEGSLETHEMVGHGGTLGDPNFRKYDLTQLQYGQPLCIEIENDDLNEISRLATREARIIYLTRHGYKSEIASVFADTMGKFSPRFFTKGFNMTIDNDGGFKLSVDFINIIELSYVGQAIK